MGSGDYPELARLPEDAVSIGGEDALEFGLQPLLDGLESFIANRRRGKADVSNPSSS